MYARLMPDRLIPACNKHLQYIPFWKRKRSIYIEDMIEKHEEP
jgi:hypothetical protein